MKKGFFLRLSVIFLFLLLGLFVLYPLLLLFKESLTPHEVFSLEVYREIMESGRFRAAMGNSLTLGVSTATVATITGFIFAYTSRRSGRKKRTALEITAILPLISPPFMFALSIILLFGRNGLISSALLGLDTLAIYGFPGLLLIQSLTLFPIAFLTISSVMAAEDPDLEMGAMNLGAGRLRCFLTITLPLTLPAILASWLLVFVGSITDFGNPIIIGGDFNVLSVQAYLEFSGMGNLNRGAALAVLLLVPSISLFLLQRKILKDRSYVTITGRNRKAGNSDTFTPVGKLPKFVTTVISFLILFIFLSIVAASLVRFWGVDWSLTTDHYIYSYDVGFKTFRKTLILALISTPLTAVTGIFIAWLRERGKIRGSLFLGILSMLSYAIPGTALGIGYILAFNRHPFRLSGTAFILIAVYLFRNIPIGVESGIAALKKISPHIEESSTNLGARDSYTLRKVTIPMVRTSFYYGALYAFIRSMTAISAVIFLISARWNHMSVLILAQTEIMRLGAASAMSLTLIITILFFLFLLSRISGINKRDLLGNNNG